MIGAWQINAKTVSAIPQIPKRTENVVPEEHIGTSSGAPISVGISALPAKGKKKSADGRRLSKKAF